MQGVLLEKVLHMSLIGCYSMAVVLPVRFLLMRCGRKYAYYLWLIVFANLCIPVTLYSSLSLIPGAVADFSVEAENGGNAEAAEEQSGMDGEHPVPVNVFPAGDAASSGEMQKAADLSEKSDIQTEEAEGGDWIDLKNTSKETVLRIAEFFWLLGVLALFTGNLFSLIRWNQRLSKSRRISLSGGERIAEADGIASPFLWGFLHPVIYLPSGMDEKEKRYIIAHEKCHRRRKDHLIKPFLYLVTILHWFNPFVWLAYCLCCRDMEISCDEEVLTRSGENIRKAYAESLLKYAAKQNGYVLTPLTFGEPSAKSRIRNVLRYRKKGAVISGLAFLCVIGAAAGLLSRPEQEDPAELSMENIPAAAQADSGESGQEVINNGGEIIRIGGEFYYIDGIKLYSDGEKLYGSIERADGSSAVYEYEMDGSGFEWLFDGRLLDMSEDGKTLYCMYEPGTAGGESLGWYDTETKESGSYVRGEVSYLGSFGGNLYVARRESDGLHVDSIRESDGAAETDLLGEGIVTGSFTGFYADGEYLVLACAETSDFYSFDRISGELRREHLTDDRSFAAAGGYIYYQKYADQSESAKILCRVKCDLTVRQQIGEDLEFLDYDEDTGTILAAKTGSDNGIRNLVRVQPDGSREQTLLDMEQMLSGNLFLGTYLDWNLEPGDQIRYSELNLLGDEISVRAEQWGYREENNDGYRDSLIEEIYLLVKADGSDCRPWNPELLLQEEEEVSYLNAPVPGIPCDPEDTGWNLEQVTDVRKDFSYRSYAPEPGTENDTYLVGETDHYRLYGKGDYESMLLACNGRYAEISYPYGSNYMILPDLMEFDYDGDGAEELSITLNIKHGTGVCIDTLFMADQAEDGSLYVYQFLEEDFQAQLLAHLTYERTGEGLKAFVDGQPAGPAVADDEASGAYERVSLGNQIHFWYGDCRIFIGAYLEFWSGDEQRAIPEYNDYQIWAELSYGDSGQFQLKNDEIRNYMLENTVRSVLEEDYMRRDPDEKDTYIRIDEIRYELTELEHDTVEVEAVILPVGAESYDYALMELARTDTGWEVKDIMYEK